MALLCHYDETGHVLVNGGVFAVGNHNVDPWVNGVNTIGGEPPQAQFTFNSGGSHAGLVTDEWVGHFITASGITGEITFAQASAPNNFTVTFPDGTTESEVQAAFEFPNTFTTDFDVVEGWTNIGTGGAAYDLVATREQHLLTEKYEGFDVVNNHETGALRPAVQQADLTDYTAFIVFRPTGLGSASVNTILAPAFSVDDEGIFRSSSAEAYRFQSDVGVINQPNNTDTIGNPKIIAGRSDSAGALRMLQSDASDFTTGGSAAASGFTPVNLFSRGNQAEPSATEGWIAEVLVFDTALTDEEFDFVSDQLRLKWLSPAQSCHTLTAGELLNNIGYIEGIIGNLDPTFAPNGQDITTIDHNSALDEFVVTAGPGYLQDAFEFVSIDEDPFLYSADAIFTASTGVWLWTGITSSPFVDGVDYKVCFNKLAEAWPGDSLNDARFRALRIQTFTGATNDMVLQWLQDGGATSGSINDAWSEMLVAKGYSAVRNDGWYALLGDLGHAGQLNDRELAFWLDGGVLPP